MIETMRNGAAGASGAPLPLTSALDDSRGAALPGDDDRWAAVLRRDATHDGAFVYAVRSTGVYCRPSCPSRRPRRDRVRFFSGATEAEHAGYRPCRRCQATDPAAGPDAALVRAVCAAVEAAAERAPTLAELGDQLGYSAAQVLRVFRRATGLTPRQYAAARRLDRFKQQLKEGATVTEALYDAGYGSSSRLYEDAAGRLGMTPGALRKGGQGEEISYAIVPSALGLLLIAATARGVCAVSMGDDASYLEGELRRDYPRATLCRDDDGLGALVTPVLRYLAGQQRELAVPVDVQATAFRWSVWEALRAIPYGSTRTYGEIARDLGRPEAARAVGRACATNPVALIIPCHRAVGASGQLTGYRWGVERKRRLLEQEHAGAGQLS